jgi:hypothetical protein
MKLAQAHDMLTKMVHATLHKDLQLSKKSARWLIKMIYYAMQKEQVRMIEAFVAIVNVGELACSEGRAGRTYPHPGGLLE